MKISEIIEELKLIYPESIAEIWDNTGWQIITGEDEEVEEVGFALDATEKNIASCKEKGIKLLVTHHPLYFKDVKGLDVRQHVGSVTKAAMEAGVSIYAMHTNFDNHNGYGLNKLVTDHVCKIWWNDKKISFEDVIKKSFQVKNIRVFGKLPKRVTGFEFCGGSGGSLIPTIGRTGAFITGEATYHQLMEKRDFPVVLVGHDASEQIGVKLLVDILNKNRRMFDRVVDEHGFNLRLDFKAVFFRQKLLEK